MPLLQKISAQAKGRSKLKTAALIGGGVAALGLGAFGLSKLLGKKKTPFGKKSTGRGSPTRLRNRVERLMLKIKLKQLTRKLFKEQMRF